MRVVLQRVERASVSISSHIVGQIGCGWLIFLGICEGDQSSQILPLVDKIVGLRLFADTDGKFNRSVQDVGGSLLIVSQFTLFADCSRGRRPSFTKAAKPEWAKTLYNEFVAACRQKDMSVETGQFGADMQVSLVNDGPVTILLDDQER